MKFPVNSKGVAMVLYASAKLPLNVQNGLMYDSLGRLVVTSYAN